MQREEKIEQAASKIEMLIQKWEQPLRNLSEEQITKPRNIQNRNIKQILGHLIDSSANNHHRIVRLQYQKRLFFPDYQQDNDTWIGVQNYENREWNEIIDLWKCYGKHIAYICRQVKPENYDNQWTDGFIQPVTLENIIIDFPEHFQLHLDQIAELAGFK